jgi:hypothetical protein
LTAQFPHIRRRVNRGWTYYGGFDRNLREEGGTVGAVKDDERDAAVDAHLKALDDELERLRKLGDAMDRRIEEAEEEKRRIEEGPGTAER